MSAARSLPAVCSIFLMSGCGSGTPATSPSSPSSGPPVVTSTPAVPQPNPGSGSSLPLSCRSLPPANGTGAGCRPEPSDFLRAVTDAVLAAQDASFLDPDSKETFAVVQDALIQSPNAYLKLIVESLDRRGLCAVYDGEELNVRNTSGFNEQFDVITSKGGSWIRYMSTCTPATPIPAILTPPVQDPACQLAPSKDSYCDKPAPLYGGDVGTALDDLIAQERLLAKPLIFDFGSRALGRDNGWKVANVDLYFSEIRKKLRAKGYCSVYDGSDELLIKKGTNRLSEHWDLLTGEGHSLRLLGAACHDAAF